MTSPLKNVCALWAEEIDLCSPCDSGYNFQADRIDDALALASDLLFELSGRQFPGSCQDRVRPICGACGCLSIREREARAFENRVWLGNDPKVYLHSALTQVDEVVIDGEVVDPDNYRIDAHRWLVRTDGERWPCNGSLVNADSYFEVTFTYGVDPPIAGVRAASRLACELALACDPETTGECSLPQRVVSVVREGLSFELIDPQEFLDKGKTGLYEVDLFLATYNPHGHRRPPGVYSPDMQGTRRVGT